MTARFLKGTFKRIDKVSEPGEERTAFVRKAVEKELDRREKKKRR